ncbi:DUF3592 domain-containing protein [Reichenbachiella agariperforans]|uniref:DUF3592 domain-containing protein n=1 Tax=Reichenbachiella agariperforans TaxID=156994 RepID=UPI001C087EEB|nr:DUF3592 domain-containing protein [Reichenbachiella agariperforans]MBU2914850.1 DUF3592 domain-containing protein [Reichenbachiella agariperforans]
MNVKSKLHIIITNMSGYSMFQSVAALILIVVFTYQGFDILLTKWVTTEARTELTDLSERVVDGDKEYYFQVTYFYQTNGKEWEHSEVISNASKSSSVTERSMKSRVQQETLWFDVSDPTNVITGEPPNWKIYFFMIIIPILLLAYSVWVAQKQYELKNGFDMGCMAV